MLHMLIVDDEKNERSVIQFLLNKFHFEFHITEAANGKEALAHLKQHPVDILFTDVKMPFMNGIDLAAHAHEFYPNTQIIFFSGYDDFEYIKKALSLRAVDYILKPINPLEFKNTIALVVERAKMIQSEQAQKEVNLTHRKNHLLYRLINDTSLDILEREFPSTDLGYLNNYSHLLLIQFEEAFFDELQQEEDLRSFQNLIYETISFPCDLINLNPSQSVLLLQSKGSTPMYYLELATRIQQGIASVYNINCYISISNEFISPSHIAGAYSEAESYLENRFFFPDMFIYSEETSSIDNQNNSDQDHYLLQSIQKALQAKDIHSLRQDVNMLFEKYENSQCVSHIYIRYLCSSLLQMLYDGFADFNNLEFNQKIEAIYSTNHFTDIQTIIKNTLNKIITEFETEPYSSKHAIHIVKQYIHKNYGKDLNLNLLADQVFFTPRYLSSLFIEETGGGINKYIKNLRMEKAKDMLINTNMKVNDICIKVGYSNVSYFCKSFQEDFGTTPEKYRQSQ